MLSWQNFKSLGKILEILYITNNKTQQAQTLRQ